MPRPKRKTQAVPVKGGWDVLPHNMGVLRKPVVNQEHPTTESSLGDIFPIANPPPITTATAIDGTEGGISSPAQDIPAGTQPVLPPSAEDGPMSHRTRSKTIAKLEVPTSPHLDRVSEDLDFKVKTTEEQSGLDGLEADILQGNGRQLRPRKPKSEPKATTAKPATSSHGAEVQDGDGLGDEGASKKRKRRAKPNTPADNQEPDSHNSEPNPKKARRVARKTKDNPYGLTPGETPFPELQAPSAEQCEEVFKLLSEMHGDVQAQAPEVIPAPSLEVMGCGEVPSVLDALIRTLISGAVTLEGANRMLNGLVENFGVLDEGIGQGSVNWNNVRSASLEEVVAAIREGGLGDKKAKFIKGILDMVHQENIERREAYLEERKTGKAASVLGAAEKTKGQKDLEIQKTEQNILSLDHLHGLSVNEAMMQFTKYPGVGVKTSACVTLFCLQRPCFAVDTHVHRFARWLGWAPQKADPDAVFRHLEVRCPDRFKYGLHQLFIRHGKTCKKCSASTTKGTDDWAKFDECPLENLLDRFDKRQSKATPKSKKAKDTEEGQIAETEQVVETKEEET